MFQPAHAPVPGDGQYDISYILYHSKVHPNVQKTLIKFDSKDIYDVTKKDLYFK